MYGEKNVLCSKCNTEIAGMRDRERDIGRVRERAREKMAWWDEKPKRMLESWREKALLLLNIKVIGHATFLTTSLSFINSLSICDAQTVSLLNPSLKLKGLCLCIASVLMAKALKQCLFQLNVTSISTNQGNLTWLLMLNLHWFSVYIVKWSSSKIDFSPAVTTS